MEVKDVKNVKPSELGIGKVSYDDIFNGKIDRHVPMVLPQKGILKAIQEICVNEGNDTFIAVTPDKILKRLKKTSISPFMPDKGNIHLDIDLMINRGWLRKTDNQIILTDHAKEQLLKIKN